MLKKLIIPFLVLLAFTSAFADERAEDKRHKVGLLVMATGRYDVYALRMIDSARKYFLPNHDRTFFLFTDGPHPQAKDIVRIEQKRLGWPFDTLKRFHVYLDHKAQLEEMDYLYALDADMLFVSEVGDEILGDLVGTRHPGYINKPGTYCRKRRSKAFVRKDEGKIYFCGGFYGGKRDNLLKLFEVNARNVDLDLKQNIVAVWHDESHLNRYFIDHPPSVILSPSYCYPEGWDLPFEKKLVALDKNHEEMRK
jgi:histo-blood group ABO system transferase